MDLEPLVLTGNQPGAAVSLILTASPTPTAVCICDDEVAVPALVRLRQYGREIPGDLSLIGFDDNPYAAAVGLTTLHQDPFAMGAEAARKTLALIAGEPLGFGTEAGPAFTTPATELILRETTAPSVSCRLSCQLTDGGTEAQRKLTGSRPKIATENRPEMDRKTIKNRPKVRAGKSTKTDTATPANLP